MDFKIEDGVKVPVQKASYSVPVDQLLPGQSIFVPDGFNQKAGQKLRAYVSALCMWARAESNKTKRFTTRIVLLDGKTGVRVWRLE